MTKPMTSENGPQEEFTVLGATANGTSLPDVLGIPLCFNVIGLSLVYLPRIHSKLVSTHCIVLRGFSSINLQQSCWTCVDKQCPTKSQCVCSVQGDSGQASLLHLSRLCKGQHLQALSVCHAPSAQAAQK